MQGEAGQQTVSAIPWSKYTHVIHYAIKPTFSNGTCGWNTSYGISGSNITNFVNAAHGAGVKAIISILQDDSISAIKTCTTGSYIGQFVNSIANFVNSNGYDGVDIDWESGIVASQYQDLISRIRSALPSATITVAVTVTERNITAAVQNSIDQINLMAYDLDFSDLSGSSVNYTWYNSPTLQGSNTQSNAADIMAWYYTNAGNAAGKIGIGMPFYGRIKKGCTDSSGSRGVTDVNQTWVSGASRNAILYRDLVNSSYWSSGTKVYDDARGSQYIRYTGGGCSTDAFVPYTGPEQLRAAANLVKSKGYGGIMTYGIPYEYIAGQSGDARYPLSSALYDAMMGSTATAPTVTTASPLAGGTVGTAYSASLSATGSTPITWSITSGSLPAGLSLSGSTISGTPSATGTFTFTVRASNSAGTNSKSLSITIAAAPAPLTITTASLPAGTVGTAYSAQLASNSTTPVTWSLAAGSLPGGLSLGPSNGLISGTPTTAGAWSVTVRAANSSASATKAFSVSCSATLSITTTSVPSAVVGSGYSVQLTSNATTTATWSLAAGSLPPGLSLNASNGIIAGNPTTAGSWSFTARVATSSASATKGLSLSVSQPAPALSITTSSLPSGVAGTAYSAQLATNSTTPVTWSQTGGSLPAGLVLATSSGVISGTPATAGTWSFTIRAANASSSATKSFTVTVTQPAGLTITTTSLPAGKVGTSYSARIMTNSSGPVTWSLPGGSLPSGLWLAASSGAITGTPTKTGSWTFTVRVSNGSQTSSRSFTITVGR